MQTVQSQRYTKVAVLLHWIIAALMIYMLIFGEDLMDRRATETSGFTWHVSIGTAIFVLSVLRLVWRMMNPPPPLPITMKPWEVKLSKATHHIFYAMLVLLPLTGFLGFAAYAARIKVAADATIFGLLPVPQYTLVPGWNFGDLHEILGNLMIALTLLHVAAALKHQFINKDGLLKRMT